ncbi:MAG: hypothetical protein CVU89_12665 [Firmicutes bacterium HGW-Firmicutes-14]|nr:MAG: hypothetical protein CVU89_12665 [Firmicutes bacterium HGW-Firmicutes-14]
MTTTKENALVAPCGLSCGHCKLYLAKDDPALVEMLVSRGFNRQSIPCPGCRMLEGKVPCAKDTHDFPKVDGKCQTYACAAGHGIDFCFECREFPCVKLQPCADMASELPHNLKVFYLCYIERQGLTEFLKKYPEIAPRYYFGKMAIGRGPQLEEGKE